ncbi:hypothetical protein BD769DRAFT_1452023 [Suillus cothurnatus]|nr:hypothetical protein BD769DRAFT_1452023 [Suillus cothurnatus]
MRFMFSNRLNTIFLCFSHFSIDFCMCASEFPVCASRSLLDFEFSSSTSQCSTDDDDIAIIHNALNQTRQKEFFGRAHHEGTLGRLDMGKMLRIMHHSVACAYIQHWHMCGSTRNR